MSLRNDNTLRETLRARADAELLRGKWRARTREEQEDLLYLRKMQPELIESVIADRKNKVGR